MTELTIDRFTATVRVADVDGEAGARVRRLAQTGWRGHVWISRGESASTARGLVRSAR